MDKMLKVLEQFMKFGLVGISNTIISMGIYYVFIYINRDLYLLGNTLGFIVSVLNSYYWNNKFVFKKDRKENHLKSLIKTYLSYGSTFILGTILLFVMVQILGISEVIAPIMNLIITIPINFILNKYWVFKEGKR